MTHAVGHVIKDKKTIAFFEYNGTVDVCCPGAYLTLEELEVNWRKDATRWRECTCEEPKIVSVELWTEYSGWLKVCDSNYCIKCLTITGDTSFKWDEGW